MSPQDLVAARARAAAFASLHAEGLLLLANAWDAGSARLARAAGARAVATSSAAVAWAHGWPDGDALPAACLLQTVDAVARATDLPLTVDLEGGYSDDPARVGALVGQVIEVGAVGINLEDGDGPAERLAAKIAAARQAARACGVDLFINARCDVFLRPLVAPAQRVAEALRRARLYREAGASGLFLIGATGEEEIAAVVRGCGLLVNVLARAGLPGLERLRELGVRRLSAGSALAESGHGLVLAMMREFLASGRIDGRGAPAMSWSELNEVMRREPAPPPAPGA